jgi:mannose-6-phosphate isomerase-like protein (cupin superfamily)
MMDTQSDRAMTNEVDLIGAARASDDFRRVLVTGEHMQVVVMTIPVGGEIGAETHPETDQVLLVVDGAADAVLDGETTRIDGGHLVFVRAGTHHNIVNVGDVPLRIATAYAPPEHDHGTIHHTKADADAAEHA